MTAQDLMAGAWGNGAGVANIDGNSVTATTSLAVSDASVAQDITFDTTVGEVFRSGFAIV